MASFVFKYFTNRILRDNQLNRFGVEDPYHEYIPIEAASGKGKLKKIPRRIPEGLSIHDTNVLNQFKKKAHRYDMWFNFLGIKFGWTNIVGVIPVAGSIISAYWSLGLLLLARKLEDGFPLDLQLLFLFNILVDFCLGLIPIVGDLIEIGYKSNSRNYLLLEKHLVRVGEKNKGLISKEEVRPGFINDKVQPFVDQNVKPGAIKAGEHLKSLIDQATKSSPTTSASSDTKKLVDDDHESTRTALSSRDQADSDKKSIRSIQSLNSLLGKE